MKSYWTHDAIMNLYPEVKMVDDGLESGLGLTIHDEDGEDVEIDEAAVSAEEVKLEAADAALRYQRDRAHPKGRSDTYPLVAEQLDMLWHAIDDGTVDKTSDFYTTLKAVKDAHPKP